MKRVLEVDNDGLMKLMGENICVIACRYIYAGVLDGVNDDCICLKNPKIVYETGAWSQPDWQDAQELGVDEIFIQTSSIESFMEGK